MKMRRSDDGFRSHHGVPYGEDQLPALLHQLDVDDGIPPLPHNLHAFMDGVVQQVGEQDHRFLLINDYKNQIRTMQALVKKGDTQAAAALAERLTESISVEMVAVTPFQTAIAPSDYKLHEMTIKFITSPPPGTFLRRRKRTGNRRELNPICRVRQSAPR